MNKKIESRLNKTIIKLFSGAAGLFLTNPSKLKYYLKVLKHQRLAAKKRAELAAAGLPAPALMIYSITNRCNLQCAGCYNQHQQRNPAAGLSGERVAELFNEARESGIGIIMLAGGEPFMNMETLKLAAACPEIIFPIFTNGTLLEEHLPFLQQHPQLLPVLSLEGDRNLTDSRRGHGLYTSTLETAASLQREGIEFGFSFTLTSGNADMILCEEFITPIIRKGAKVIFFVEYVPQNEQEEALCLKEDQKKKLIRIRRRWARRFPALFFALPGDEEAFGGCLAAGRGFIHISADGSVEPCPFAPYSTSNLKTLTLKEALASVFIKKIRDSHHLLSEAKGGCVLWENKEWVEKQKKVCT